MAQSKKSLDASLTELLQTAATQNGVQGALLVDSNGLNIAARGVAPAKASGFVRAISTRAKELSTHDEQPTVCIETDAHNIFISSQNQTTTALYKNRE